MSDIDLTEGPSQTQIILTLLGCMLLAAFLQLACEFGQEKVALLGLDGHVAINAMKLVVAVVLAGIAFRTSGLTLGDKLAWKRRWIFVALWWLLPPLLVLAVYPNFTSRPFHGASWGFWLLAPIAEELLFGGFIYGRMAGIFGKPSTNWRGAFSPTLIITAFLAALFFWPFLRNADNAGKNIGVSYAEFQMLYVFLFSLWMFNIRRWTGSILPAVLNHILVNVLLVLL